MRRTIIAAALVGATGLLGATSASAQELVEGRDAGDVMQGRERAPARALEIGADTGFTQGFGTAANNDMDAGAGQGVGATIAYRFNPRWSLGFNGGYQQYGVVETLEGEQRTRGFTTAAMVGYHFMPWSRIDPVLNVGGGYRAVFNASDEDAEDAAEGADDLAHGFELAKVQIDLDIRLNENVAVGPMVGADLVMFTLTDPPGEVSGFGDGVHSFVYVGAQGRFDLTGDRIPPPGRGVARR